MPLFETVWVVTILPVAGHDVEMVVFKDESKAIDFWEIMNVTSSREVSIEKSRLLV